MINALHEDLAHSLRTRSLGRPPNRLSNVQGSSDAVLVEKPRALDARVRHLDAHPVQRLSWHRLSHLAEGAGTMAFTVRDDRIASLVIN